MNNQTADHKNSCSFQQRNQPNLSPDEEMINGGLATLQVSPYHPCEFAPEVK